MNIVGKLTLRHLKENKKRTLITIFGVIVSVAMITAVTTSISSFLRVMGDTVGKDEGDWVGYYMNVDASAVQKAKNFDNVKDVILCQDIGNYMPGQLDEDGKNLLSVRSQETGSFSHLMPKLLEGDYPAGPDEIIVRKRFIQLNQLGWNVGDTITLEQIQRYWTDDKARESNRVRQFSAYDAQNQRSETIGQRTFKLVGTFSHYSSSEYNAITGLDAKTVIPGDTVDLYTTQEKLSYGSSKQVERLGAEIGSYTQITTHNDYLRYNGYLEGDMAVAVYGAAAIILLIIMIASVTLIYNAFAISLNERSRYLGMLASVGATKRQKRSTVYYEGAFIGAVGIPLGILAGIGGIGVTFQFVGPLMKGLFMGGGEMEENTLKLVVSPFGIGISIVLSILTILVSAYIPGRKASKTTPIDAIRSTKDVNVSAKRLKTSKITRGLFGYEGELALKNIKRNRKKYRVIISSLAISVILFLSVNAFTGMMTQSFDMTNKTSPCDLVIYVHNGNREAAEKMNQFIDHDARIDSVSRMKSIVWQVVGSPGMFHENYDSNILADGRTYADIFIKGVPDQEFRQVCEKNGIDPTPFFAPDAPGGILLNQSSDYVRDNRGNVTFRSYAPFHVKEGATLTLTDHIVPQEGELPSVIAPDESNLSITAQKVITGKLEGLDAEIALILPESMFDKLIPAQNTKAFITYTNNIMTKEFEAVDDAAMKYIAEEQIEDSVSVINYSLDHQQQRSLLAVINVFVYGFITLITLICVANIFNTINTGIELRRREFAMIKSMGMTPKGFRKMISFESLFYGVKALVIGLPLSLLLHFAIWKMLSGSFETSLASTFNWWAYGAAILAVFLISGAALLYSMGKVRKDNIIETLKSEDT